ncbi:MAG: FtsX-like permease family protein [Acidimicrobiia bacterium]|nr:FtsX-like permease family protein [Acidimicrobiia bacterium]
MTPAVRAALRVARRSARRDWKRTGFVVALIAMPVAVAIVVAGITRSNQIDPETQVASRFGSATLRVEGYSMSRGGVARAIDDVVPAEAPSLVFRSIWMRVGGSDGALVEDLDIAHPLAVGMLTLVEGTAPGGAGEVAMSASLADRLGVGLGDQASFPLEGTERRLTVSGIVVDPAYYDSQRLLFTPEGFDAIVSAGGREQMSAVALVDAASPDQAARAINDVQERQWEEATSAFPPELTNIAGPEILSLLTGDEIEALVELAPTVSYEQLRLALSDLVGERTQVTSGGLWAESSREALAAHGNQSVLSTPSVVGTLVGALLLAEVALVAGAAYATGTRRRLREIGLLTANGATDRHVRLIVIGEGLVAGVLGAAIGIGMGLVVLSLGTPILQDFARKLLVGPPVSAVDVVAPALAGIAAATVAAWLPAPTAARVPTITALQGRMPLSAPPRWIVPLGVALTGLGTFLLVVARTALGNEAVAQAGIAVVLMIGGFVLLAGPMVAGAGLLADRVRATWRLVLRDSARQRTRAAAAVAAMMVVLIAPVVMAASLSTNQRRDLIYGSPSPVTGWWSTGTTRWAW